VEEKPCPKCGETHLEVMCPLDHCHCNHEIISGIDYCPLCGKAVCPECGSHDVTQISRVTGYLQDVSGWNASKQQELKDRMRYSIA
jgi:anaerobic ribonucleoside-triphosphate reductase